MSDALKLTVKGNVIIEKTIKTFEGAILYVYVEDVGMVDESSTRLASLLIDPVSHQPGLITKVPFSIDCVIRNPASDNIVRAHVSLHGNPEIVLGDLLSMQAYTIHMSQPKVEMTIHVHEVT